MQRHQLYASVIRDGALPARLQVMNMALRGKAAFISDCLKRDLAIRQVLDELFPVHDGESSTLVRTCQQN